MDIKCNIITRDIHNSMMGNFCVAYSCKTLTCGVCYENFIDIRLAITFNSLGDCC